VIRCVRPFPHRLVAVFTGDAEGVGGVRHPRAQRLRLPCPPAAPPRAAPVYGMSTRGTPEHSVCGWHIQRRHPCAQRLWLPCPPGTSPRTAPVVAMSTGTSPLQRLRMPRCPRQGRDDKCRGGEVVKSTYSAGACHVPCGGGVGAGVRGRGLSRFAVYARAASLCRSAAYGPPSVSGGSGGISGEPGHVMPTF